MPTKVAINGFGRIGRQVLHIMLEKYAGDLEVVAINDLTDNQTLAHLFKYDSTYGKFSGEVKVINDSKISIDGKEIVVFSEKDPSVLPWKDLGVEIVLESTGVFRTIDGASLHLKAGAKKVLISAPCKDDLEGTIVLGVNEDIYSPEKHHILSNASCTTNCLAPVCKVLHEKFNILRGIMTTIHSVTNDQRILDLPHSDLRRARSAIQSMIPTTTGAAKAVALVLPELKGKLDGLSIRVPLPTVSLVDLTCDVEKDTSVEEVNQAFKEAAGGSMKGILEYQEEPLVSVDYRKNAHSAIVDALSTKVMDGKMIKILAWYDNEWGYSNRYADLCKYVADKL